MHDPLWLLARQWQVGEFAAEDSGSPLQARARLERAPLTRYLPGPLPEGPVEAARYDPRRLPLEVVVEREPGSPDLRLAFEAGLHFFRLLDRHGVGKYRAAYLERHPLPETGDGDVPPDPETARLIRVARGRVPDGAAIAVELRAADGGLPDEPVIDADDEAAVATADGALLAWLDGRMSRAPDDAPSSWNPDRMEYGFAVGAPTEGGERVLVAPEYAQGHLDWHAFDRRSGASLGAAADDEQREALVRVAIPAPVTYRGMPVARWWEFEDGQVNFGSTDVEPSNLLRLLLLNFALDYGNDWFIVPVELPADAVYRVASLVVTDSFGVRTLVRPYTRVQPDGSHWRMFCLSLDGVARAEDGTGAEEGDGDDLLFLPPVLAPSLNGEPVEEVLLVRDEVANLAWAVERRVEDAGGRPVNRFEQYQRSASPTPGETATAGEEEGGEGAGTTGDLRYRLATTVPDYWVPLVPTRVDPGKPDIRLVRGRVLVEREGTPVAPAPLGRLLEPGRPLRVYEEVRSGSTRKRPAGPARGSLAPASTRAGPTAAHTSGSVGGRAPAGARVRAGCASTRSRRVETVRPRCRHRRTRAHSKVGNSRFSSSTVGWRPYGHSSNASAYRIARPSSSP
ncbi:MAG: hypothetical protein P8177_13785 [Gemmatimonadota bacterium]